MAQPGTPGSTASRVAAAQGAGVTTNLGNGIFERAGQYFAKVRDKFIPIGKDQAGQILSGGRNMLSQVCGIKCRGWHFLEVLRHTSWPHRCLKIVVDYWEELELQAELFCVT